MRIGVDDTETLLRRFLVASLNGTLGNAPSTAAAPTFSVAAGSYTTEKVVTLSTSTGGAAIHYTTNGSDPNITSKRYLGPIAVNSSQTVKAITIKNDFTPSSVAAAAYVITLPGVVSAPVFSPSGGSFSATQSVSISTATSGATIHYTLDGSNPTSSSATYSAPLTVSSSETIKAIAVKGGSTDSSITSASYVVSSTGTVATPVFSPSGGSFTGTQNVTISSTSGATIYYTYNGTTPTTSSNLYTGPISVSTSSTLKAIAVKDGFNDSAVGSVSFTFSAPGVVATPTFSPAAGTYNGTQTVDISTATSGAAIHYTTDGSTPTSSSPIFSSSIFVSSSETLKAIATKGGSTDSSIASSAYVITNVISADLVLDFAASGSVGDLFTGAKVAASLHPATGAPWTVTEKFSGSHETNVINHTFVSGAGFGRRTPLKFQGADYSGSNSKSLTFDMTSHHQFEGFGLHQPLTGGPDIYCMTISAVARFNAIGSGGYDWLTLPGAGYATMQQNLPGFLGGTAGDIHNETQDQVGGTARTYPIAIDHDVVYSVSFHRNVSTGECSVVVVDHATGNLVGVTSGIGAINPGFFLTFFELQDYLTTAGGDCTFGSICVAWNKPTLRLMEEITIPPPDHIVFDQTAANTTRIMWEGKGLTYRLEKNVNGTGWVVAVLEFHMYDFLTYADASFSSGDVVQYRVIAIIGDQSSVPAIPAALTILNSHPGYPAIWQQSGQEAYATVSMNTSAELNHVSQKIKGIHTSAISISKVCFDVSYSADPRDIFLDIGSSSDFASGTIYGTSLRTSLASISSGGELVFSFFTPVVIPANTDFWLRIRTPDGILQMEITGDDAWTIAGQGYTLLYAGTGTVAGILAVLKFRIFTNYTPLAVSASTATQISNTEVEITWSDSNAGRTAYQIDRFSGGSWTNNVFTTSVGGVSHTFTGLTNGTAYKWRVSAILPGYSGSQSATVETGTITFNSSLFVGAWIDSMLVSQINGSVSMYADYVQLVQRAITLPAGTVNKLRVRFVNNASATEVRIGLYSGGSLITSGIASGSSANAWFEIPVTPLVIGAGTYSIGLNCEHPATIATRSAQGAGSSAIDQYGYYLGEPIETLRADDNGMALASYSVAVGAHVE